MNTQHCPEIAAKKCQQPLRWHITRSDTVYEHGTPTSDIVDSSRSHFSQTGGHDAPPAPVVCQPDFEGGSIPVMPAQAGIQRLQAQASGESAWIPAFAGMTPPQPTLHNHRDGVLAEIHTFLPGLVTHFLAQQELPTKRELAVLFVDIADSTSTVVRQTPEKALAEVQRFMNLITEVALAHHGDVKDYEGDGALLYFASVAQAARAAINIQQALAAQNERKEATLQARLSLSVGEVIIGVVGSSQRRSVALIGPAVHLASRLLKHIPPGGIIAPLSTIERLDQQAPDLAQQFQLFGQCLVLKGFEEECVTAYHIPSPVSARGIAQSVLS
jgi:class 3 adenylate cyclase